MCYLNKGALYYVRFQSDMFVSLFYIKKTETLYRGKFTLASWPAFVIAVAEVKRQTASSSSLLKLWGTVDGEAGYSLSSLHRHTFNICWTCIILVLTGHCIECDWQAVTQFLVFCFESRATLKTNDSIPLIYWHHIK